MIGYEIKKLRNYLKLSQEEFGLELGVSQRAVSSWESNTNDVPISIISEIYNKWNISPNTIILGGTEFNIVIDRLLILAKDENLENEILKNLKKFLNHERNDTILNIIGNTKGTTFIEKLSEMWSGKGERRLIILNYFIEYLEKQNIETINKLKLISLVNNFSIPTKIKLKHFLVINKKDEISFKEWINTEFDDIEANLLIKKLSEAKEFIKSELNFLNRFWI